VVVISLIAAVADNGVIGAGGAMPWRLPSDLKHFRRVTMGKPIVMGRRTLESIGKPLDGRLNVILTRDPAFAQPGTVAATSLDAALETAAAVGADEIIIGGGGEVYAAAMARADRLYITHVALAPDGDTVFPPIDPALWQAVSDEPMQRSERDSAEARFVVYERRA
jgi:dihydrofolate reductase